MIDHIAKPLCARGYQGNRLELVEHCLTGRLLEPLIDGPAKKKFMEDTVASLGLHPSQVMAIGDGVNDLDILSSVGTAVSFNPKIPLIEAGFPAIFDSHLGMIDLLGH